MGTHVAIFIQLIALLQLRAEAHIPHVQHHAARGKRKGEQDEKRQEQQKGRQLRRRPCLVSKFSQLFLVLQGQHEKHQAQTKGQPFRLHFVRTYET
jgi:hypothetical protein